MASVPASAVKNIPAKNLRICHLSRNSVGADLLFQLLPIDRFGLTQAVGCLGSIVSLVDRPFQQPRTACYKQGTSQIRSAGGAAVGVLRPVVAGILINCFFSVRAAGHIIRLTRRSP